MKARCVVVTPRFEKGNFAGYDQCGGNVYLDTIGHLYGLVRIEDYNAMRDRFENVLMSIEDDIGYGINIGTIDPNKHIIVMEILRKIQNVLNDKPELE